MTDRRYAINVAYRTQEFFREVTGTGMKISSVLPGVEFVFGGPPDDDSDRQIEELEALIARRVNGIILFPTNPKRLIATIDRAISNGIPVVTLFSDVAGSKRLTLVGGPERESGRRLAQQALSTHSSVAVDKTSKIKVIVSFNKPGETVTDERLGGIRDAIEGPKYRDIVELVRVVDDHGNAEKGAAAISRVLQEHKDIRIIFGLNARSAIGALTALKGSVKANGEGYKPSDVIVTGWDSDDDVLKAIDDGWVHSTSVLNSSLCTQISFGILEAQNLGYLYPESLQLRELSFPAVPDQILIPETLVDRGNVDGFRRKK